MTQDVEIKEQVVKMSFAEFLEGVPPSSNTVIPDLFIEMYYQGGGISGYKLNRPEIQLHCSENSCNGLRFFRCTSQQENSGPLNEYQFTYLRYLCSNCRKDTKVFALAVTRTDKCEGECYKFGELPIYGPPTSSRLIKLIGPDRDIFLKGRRCENQGLGIGAFVYYRRVVESQKNRILDEIIKVSEKLNASTADIEILVAAKKEVQFSTALASVKNVIPQSLLINGHNPLSLLHSALSEGLHNQTDEYCLEIAHSVRVILGELSDRLSQALKDEAELNNALSKLLKENSNNKSKQ